MKTCEVGEGWRREREQRKAAQLPKGDVVRETNSDGQATSRGVHGTRVDEVSLAPSISMRAPEAVRKGAMAWQSFA